MSSTLSTSALVGNLRSIIDLLCSYPSHTVFTACDCLGINPTGIPGDLLDLQGADAVDAIEGELVALTWKAVA